MSGETPTGPAGTLDAAGRLARVTADWALSPDRFIGNIPEETSAGVDALASIALSLHAIAAGGVAPVAQPVETRETSSGDALRVAAQLVDRFDGRARLSVSGHTPGHLSMQVCHTSGERADAQDRSRRDGYRLIAQELGRPIVLAQWDADGVKPTLPTEIDGVAVEIWAAIYSPQVAAQIRERAATGGTQ